MTSRLDSALIEAVASRPNGLFALVVPTRRRANQRFTGLVQSLEQSGVQVETNRSEWWIRFSNGAKVLVLGIESTRGDCGPPELRGLSLDGAVLEHEGQLTWMREELRIVLFVHNGWLMEKDQ